MSKRFTETTKWEDPWFRSLNCKHKALWVFLCDKADNAGVWKKDYGLASFQINETITEDDIKLLNTDKERVFIEKDALIITDFIEFQIGNITSEKLTNLQINCLKLVEKHKEKYEYFTRSLPVAYGYIYKGKGIGKGKGKGKVTTSEQSSPIKYSIKDKELSCLLLDLIRENNPSYKELNIDKWSEVVRKMREIDNRTPEQIEYVIRWCQKSEFWQANILSTSKLREKFDTLVAQIKRNNNSSKGITII